MTSGSARIASVTAGRVLTDALDQADLVVVHAAPRFGANGLVRAWANSVQSPVELWRASTAEDLNAYAGPYPAVAFYTGPEIPEIPPSAVKVSAHQLRFTAEDIAALVPPAHADAVDRIATETGGWPALVSSVLGRLERNGWVDAQIHIHAAIAEHFEGRSERWLPARWNATLDWIACAGGATALDIGKDAPVDAAIVLAAVEIGLLTWTGLGRDRAACLLPFGRDARVDRLRQDPIMHAEVLLSIADARLESGARDGGLAAAAELEDWPRCARIQDRWWRELLFGSHRELSESVIQRLPAYLLRSYPRLSLRAESADRLPLGSTPYEIPRNPKEIEKILVAGRATEVLDTTFLGMLGQRINGNPKGAATIAAQTAQLGWLSLRAADSGRDRASLWFVHAGLSAHLAGDESAARGHYQLASSASRFDSLGFSGADARAKLGALLALRGENSSAAAMIDGVDTGGCEDWIAAHIDICLRIAENSMAVDSFESIPADREAIMLSDPYAFDEMWIFAFVTVARLLLARSREREVLGLAQELRALRPVARRSNGVQPRLLALMEAEAYLRLGQGVQALARLEPFGGTDPQVAVVEARVLLSARELTKASSQVALVLGSALASPRTMREARLIGAAIAAETDQPGLARTRAAELLAESERENDIWSWMTLPERSLAALGRLVEIPRPPEAGDLGSSHPRPELSLIKLTGRERDVLRAIAQGQTRTQIAAEFFISVNTVKTQQRALYKKLGVNSKADALAAASKLGLLDG